MTGESATAAPPKVDWEDPRPLKALEAQPLSRLGLNQFYGAIGRGEIPSIRVGRRILLPRKAFRAWLDGSSDAA